MVIIPSIGCLAISGGKYECNKKSKYFNDIHLLDLKTLDWIIVDISGTPKNPVSDHAACVCESAIYIFGGLTEKGFANSSVGIIEFN